MTAIVQFVHAGKKSRITLIIKQDASNLLHQAHLKQEFKKYVKVSLHEKRHCTPKLVLCVQSVTLKFRELSSKYYF